ncbi:hypothetical protein DSM106972_088320 [Dulcicalothrix desertica PCC 7102]|uniref:XisH protein n=1 Tax=Dulcicalothrix desertica PCC 7102 TaxID=232991 RepID=A0A3S1C6F0_9CYAN|nr:hypothetical protein DSM106972_088320 [Dulcicalothrix desertica PCC 7102]
MPAKDRFHDAVRQALIKQQWIITADPLIIKIEEVQLDIDLAAERILAAEKSERKIAVEIKSFLRTSAITDFHVDFGSIFKLPPWFTND